MNIKYLDEGSPCLFCGAEDAKFWGNPYRHRDKVYLSPVCAHCIEVEVALDEADADEIRYTYIATAKHGGYGGGRCCCGGVSLNSLKGKCVRCWKEERMLGKKVAEHKMFSRLLTELRREIKEIKKRECSTEI